MLKIYMTPAEIFLASTFDVLKILLVHRKNIPVYDKKIFLTLGSS